jgi:hypothetical protein
MPGAIESRDAAASPEQALNSSYRSQRQKIGPPQIVPIRPRPNQHVARHAVQQESSPPRVENNATATPSRIPDGFPR